MINRVEIGGHLMRPDNAIPGLTVFRETLGDGSTRIVKEAFGPNDLEGLHNEAKMLTLMSGTGFAPELLEEHEDYIIQEDLGEHHHEAKDGELLRHNSVKFLHTIRSKGINHGDLTGVNVFFRDNSPVAIDWQQSHMMDEKNPNPKRSLNDSYFFWRTMQSFPTKDHPTPDTPRVLRRWMAVMGGLKGWGHGLPLKGKTFLDLGCFQGDFCALAGLEGMNAVGVDQGGFRQGEDSVAIGNGLWDYMNNVNLVNHNILDWVDFGHDAVMMFSTWPYIFNDYGLEVAYDLLKKIIDQCGILFFETQLAGDGPGPKHLVTDDDVANMLGQWGDPEPLVTIPVTGRPASRTVWKVTQ